MYCNYIVSSDYRLIDDFYNYCTIGVICPIITHSGMIKSELKIVCYPLGEWISGNAEYR